MLRKSISSSFILVFLSLFYSVGAGTAVAPPTITSGSSEQVLEQRMSRDEWNALEHMVQTASNFRLTREEIYFCKTPNNTLLCTHAYGIFAVQAIKSAEEKFPQTTARGRGDAYRHCYWSGMIAHDSGVPLTIELTNQHESQSRGIDRTMDLRNNRIGAAIGERALSNNDVQHKCENLARSGQLWRINHSVLQAPGTWK